MSDNVISQKVAKYYNIRGQDYSQSWMPAAKKRLSQMEIDLIEKEIKFLEKQSGGKRLKALDIGIGTGRISDAVLKQNVDYYGTDVSDTMVSLCRERFKNNNKVNQIIVHNILDPLPRDWGKFDLVTAIRVLDYTPDWKKEIENIYRAMNPGGVLIFTFVNKYSTMFISNLIWKKKRLGIGASSRKELTMAMKEIGFTQCRMSGFSRLLDIFYDWCDNNLSANILLAIEKNLGMLFGQTLFVRLFYVICKK